jgi:hypothetical protein
MSGPAMKGIGNMCMNCGCGMPYEKHGRADNIDANDLQRAAAANGQSMLEAAEHILEAAEAISGQYADSGYPFPVAGSATGK